MAKNNEPGEMLPYENGCDVFIKKEVNIVPNRNATIPY
jgi:hypothetical protein